MTAEATPGDSGFTIRPASEADGGVIWAILEPVLRKGETYALPSTWNRGEALAYWFAAGHHVFVAEENGQILGTYYLQANQVGGGDHVANCGYLTATNATGRGVARQMCAHSLDQARTLGFVAMQFNFVVSTNIRAIALWERMGFSTVGRVPGGFRHPLLGFVDSLVMHRTL